MRTLLLPEGSGLTDQQFSQGALETPLSGWQSFGYGVRSTIEETLLGTIVREAQAPDVSGEIERSRWGGRFVPDTPEQAQAKGEKVYATPEEYKASPWFRENIPFEPGMTEARAQALSQMRDLRAIRDFYTAKRPIASFLGGVAGSALAPENYIPILGEFSGAATTSRMGRIALRALTSSGDAALNTTAFQTLTAPERARLGDDTSWQAIGENAAFAAIAGAVIGSALGGYNALRGRYDPKPAVEPPPTAGPAATPPAPARMGAPRPGDLQPTGLAPEAFTYRLDLPSEPSAQSTPVWRVTAETPLDTILDRIETPQARAQASAVMNDAVSGLAIDGEVRLGDQARVTIGELRGTVARAVNEAPATALDVPPSANIARVQPIDLGASAAAPNIKSLPIAEAGVYARDFAREKFAGTTVVNAEDGSSISIGWQGIKHAWRGQLNRISLAAFGKLDDILRTGAHVGPLPDRLGRQNIKGVHYYDAPVFLDGEASVVRAVVREMADGRRYYDHFEIAPKGSSAPGDMPGPASSHQVIDGGPSGGNQVPQGAPATGTEPTPNIGSPTGIGNTAHSFTVPAPEPRPAQLSAAYKVVDALPKTTAEGAGIAQLIESAKAEGLDPATGGHDLETDIAIMRELGTITPDEEKALALADETFKAAEAWDDVTKQLITCKATNS